MDLGIAGRTALVTGASTGIGRAVAIALAGEGVRLAIVARREGLLNEVSSEIKKTKGVPPVIIVCDFLQKDAPEKIAEAALKGLGSVEILVNNAGGSRRFRSEERRVGKECRSRWSPYH